jgi:hypothetical protein
MAGLSSGWRRRSSAAERAPHEREAGAQLQEEALNVIDQALLDLAFAPWIGRPEEIEQVRIFEDLPGHVRVEGREGRLEVADGLAVPFVRAAFDLQTQNRLGPAVSNGLLRVPQARLFVADAFEEGDVLPPG